MSKHQPPLLFLRSVSADFYERLCYACDELKDARAVSEDGLIVECYACCCLFIGKKASGNRKKKLKIEKLKMF